MGMIPNEKRRRDWRIALLIGVLLLVVVGIPVGYALIEGKPFRFGPLLGPICGWTVVFPLFLLWVSKKSPRAPLPEPLRTKLLDALHAEGIDQVQLVYSPQGPAALFPRPQVMGYHVSLSRRVAEDFSPEAILWSVKTDIEASVQFARRGMPLSFLPMLGSLFGIALCQRWGVPSGFYAIPIGLLVLSFVLMCNLGIRYQYAADRRFTQTEADRQAAKEALSYPYFAQGDQSPGKRWFFFRAELRKRAEHLGIELERGYRPATERRREPTG